MNVLGFMTVCALAMAFVACDGGSGTSAGGVTCDVIRTETTVKVVNEVAGLGGYYSTVTDQGNHVIIESEYRYNDAQAAAQSCEEQKRYAQSWRDGSVSAKCSGNSVYVTEYDEGTLDDHQRNFDEMCEDMLSGGSDDDDDEFDY